MTTLRKLTRRPWLALTLAALAAIGLAVGGYHAFWHSNLKRFQEVRPGVFYRSGLASEWGYDYAVRRYGIRTVISALPEDPILRTGWIDPGRPSGPRESQCLVAHGLAIVHLPMGDEACWPWPTPWQFEEFFNVCDDRQRWPILLHCVGGRHRTGVLSALFRLEYDRWEVAPTLEEMYRFEFGRPQVVSEHNLRTYVRRPRPNDAAWTALRKAFAPVLEHAPEDYEALVYGLRNSPRRAVVDAALLAYVRDDKPFALPLAARLVEPRHPASSEVVARAAERIAAATSTSDATTADPPDDLACAAALIADYGTPDQQQALQQALQAGLASPEPSAAHHALASGVFNRYTRNRLPYWRLLLADRRERRDDAAPGRRYCDTAAARLSIVIDRALIAHDDAENWDRGVEAAEAWFREHTVEVQLTTLVPPEGRKSVASGSGLVEEDLSRVRR